jgi:hypothetical protein
MISSNVIGVMGRLQKAQAKIPAKVKIATNPDRYREQLRFLAELTMQSIADTDEERAAIPGILSTMTGNRTAGGMEFGMGGTSIEHFDLEPGEVARRIDRDAVENWVRNFKELKPKDKKLLEGDATSGYEMLTSRVIAAFTADPKLWFRTDEAGRGALDPTGLAHIAGIVNMPVAKVDRMLRAVLYAWVNFTREMMPQAIGYQIRQAFKE